MPGSDERRENNGEEQIEGQSPQQKLFSMHPIADESTDGCQ
jgi:hypothetical protein